MVGFAKPQPTRLACSRVSADPATAGPINGSTRMSPAAEGNADARRHCCARIREQLRADLDRYVAARAEANGEPIEKPEQPAETAADAERSAPVEGAEEAGEPLAPPAQVTSEQAIADLQRLHLILKRSYCGYPCHLSIHHDRSPKGSQQCAHFFRQSLRHCSCPLASAPPRAVLRQRDSG